MMTGAWMRRLSVGLVFGVVGLSAAMTAAPSGAPVAAVADAAQQGDTNAVRALLMHSADVNAAQGDGMTALHWAAMRGDADLVRVLLAAGAHVNAVTRLNAHTPLLLAAEEGRAAVMPALLKAGADVNGRTSNGTTALMFAAGSGDLEGVKILLDHGADVNAKETFNGLTPAMFAAASSRTAVIRELGKHGADMAVTTKVLDVPNIKGLGPSGGGSHEMQGGLTAVLLAARQGYRETVEALLEAGADVNQVSAGDGTSPLLIATINGQFDLARWLVMHSADPKLASQNGVTPLYAALNCEWAPKVSYPQPRAHLDQQTTYLALMQALLEHGADVNARVKRKVWYSDFYLDFSGLRESGATPFWRAAYASDIDAMKLLVAHGADPMIPTVRPPGRRSAWFSGRKVTDVEGIPPISPVGGPGVPPIVALTGTGYIWGLAAPNVQRYAPTGRLAALKYLVEELHADVNAVDDEGETALHNAAAQGDLEMIQYLVSKGANVRALTRRGQTTADYANGPAPLIPPAPEARALLEKLGAKNNHDCQSC
jgi:ankyrin repeat protein